MAELYHDEGLPAGFGRKLLIATTAYDTPDACYVQAIQATRMALEDAGIQTAYLLLTGNCHVDDARNSVVAEFLASDATEMVFIDADVQWLPDGLVRLCSHDVDFVGAVYPYRDIGRRTEMPCRNLPGAEIDQSGLLEMDGLPTGFMLLSRTVLETLAKDAQQFTGRDPGLPMPLLFERATVDGKRMSGDLVFCHKWRQTGGQIWADPEIRLGHSAKTVVWGSLAACQRRQQGATLSWLANRIREGKEHPEDFEEAVEAVDNRFAASSLVLAACTLSARKGAGDIIEAGSGLTTVMMAAAIPGRRVYAMEHDPVYSFLTQRWARSAGVNNIALIEGMQDCWYDLTDCDLPERFALGLCDGPPRHYGTRMRFFEKFGQRCDRIIVDDVDNAEYLRKILDWCSANNRAIEHQQGRLAVIR
jgi:hypothetical protein